MKQYKHQEVESKWQKIWDETGLYKTTDSSDRGNYYALVMFPYPSGDLHSGHWYNFGPGDTHARFKRMQGNNVLHPIGFDAFGLPAENAAIKRNIAPAKWTEQNIANMTGQLKQLGAMYDWDKMVNTSKPDYYRWTQWLFLKLYEAGLAYRAKGIQNWCPKDQTVLANEQTISESGEKGVCVRCGTKVEKKELEQWFFKITDYADRLLSDLDKVEWPDKVKTMQENWIGRSEGSIVRFKLENSENEIEVFTTRIDTLFSGTFIVLAPEHKLVSKITTKDHEAEVKSYITEAQNKNDNERLEEEDKEKTGVFTGSYVINPASGDRMPVWVADFVVGGYGTGAVFGDAHDERDVEFARKYSIPLKTSIKPIEGDDSKIKSQEEVFTGYGILYNSKQFDGMTSQEAKKAITTWLHARGEAEAKTQYKLRDWLISRQRYWGAPIPIVYCEKDGIVPVPEKDLPVTLPLDVEFEPTGQSPLAKRDDFVKTTCPKCGGPAKRETDTMDTFVDSSWYFLRYPNVEYADGPFDPGAVERWLPVDQYMGGIEHAILHLLYARFVTKALHDQKLINFDEPFKKLFNQGIILGPDGQKMSKSRGNVVNPDDWVSKYGADTFRAYLMFMGPYDQGGPFDTKGIAGTNRFLHRVWTLVQEFAEAKTQGQTNPALETALMTLTHKTIKKVTRDIQGFSFNTAIAALMEMTNELYRIKADLPLGAAQEAWSEVLGTLLKLMAPLTPHIAEELWQELGGQTSIHLEDWPKYREDLVREEIIEIPVQVNGRLRGTVDMPVEATEEEVVEAAKNNPQVSKYLEPGIAKTIYVPRRLVNFVVKG